MEIGWHKLVGLLLTELFKGSPFSVELEVDLSLKQQFLDVVVVRRKPGPFEGLLPDGLENLKAHNLISFKSHHEAFDDWAVKELVAYYVNYRKQISPNFDELLPDSDFQMYGVCTRYPEKLAGRVTMEEVARGVYDIPWGTDQIRWLVIRDLSESTANAVLQLLSAKPELVRGAESRCTISTDDMSSLIDHMLNNYRIEEMNMPYTMEDFRREHKAHILREATTEERLAGLPPEERLRGLSLEDLQKLRETLDRLTQIPAKIVSG